ncbi:hypothetical protein [Anaerosolibacter carboniphilus]|uniref:hypothetical protein n=1 Tax=Anaerosolibacter carboniphilus TaxID=1417629 RepID=UPI0016190B19|nr:hypothetical protein [Anaerosolibacter carboniphilus]
MNKAVGYLPAAFSKILGFITGVSKFKQSKINIVLNISRSKIDEKEAGAKNNGNVL